jgi:hypothetical protein
MAWAFLGLLCLDTRLRRGAALALHLSPQASEELKSETPTTCA